MSLLRQLNTKKVSAVLPAMRLLLATMAWLAHLTSIQSHCKSKTALTPSALVDLLTGEPFWIARFP